MAWMAYMILFFNIYLESIKKKGAANKLVIWFFLLYIDVEKVRLHECNMNWFNAYNVLKKNSFGSMEDFLPL